MRKIMLIWVVLVIGLGMPPYALATNGTNLIGIGPISRAMGGVGIAAPQDAISAVFANPAGMCFGPYCPGSEVNFAGTLFAPDVNAKVNRPAQAFPPGSFGANSDDEVYAIPAFGLSVPVKNTFPYVRFGLSAFGVSGLGVDYRNTSLDQPNFFPSPPLPDPPGASPLIGGEFSQLQIMRFAPSVAVQPSAKFSFGVSMLIDYTGLDLREGSEFTYGFGGQLGLIYQPIDNLSLGLLYRSPISVTHNNVFDFDGDGRLDNLDLDSPQEIGLGVSYTFLENRLLLEVDGKWINWSDADGYKDFDWDDQYVFAIGAQFEVIPGLYLRAGYNYADHPLKDNSGFNGQSFTSIQGKSLPSYYYESFRVIGLPAIVEHHITAGFGYEFSNKFALEAGLVRALENDFKETGTDLFGNPVELKSELSEWSLDFGMTFRF